LRRAPPPADTMAMTAPMPMTMPKLVRDERPLFTSRAARATRSAANKLMKHHNLRTSAPGSRRPGGIRCGLQPPAKTQRGFRLGMGPLGQALDATELSRGRIGTQHGNNFQIDRDRAG